MREIIRTFTTTHMTKPARGDHPTNHIASLAQALREESRNDSSPHITRSMICPTASQYERDFPLNIYRDSCFQYGFSDARFPILISVAFLAQVFQKAMYPLLTSPGCLEHNWFENRLLCMTCLQNSLILPFGFCIRNHNTRRIRGLSPYRYRRIRSRQREIQSYLGESLPLRPKFWSTQSKSFLGISNPKIFLECPIPMGSWRTSNL